MNSLNKFFRVQSAVSAYTEAEFRVRHSYEEKIERPLIMFYCIISLIIMILGLIKLSGAVFFTGAGMAAILFMYAYSSHTKLVTFIRKKVLYLFLGASIEEKVMQKRFLAKLDLYDLRNTIEDMTHSTAEWKEVAKEANAIIDPRN